MIKSIVHKTRERKKIPCPEIRALNEAQKFLCQFIGDRAIKQLDLRDVGSKFLFCSPVLLVVFSKRVSNCPLKAIMIHELELVSMQ